ncbi:pyruvate:ferredoxin (flavodoxin) oxidoreductase [bacterium]|nr:pyruvate:ferredoxin (flavodoxin) oxidoreductase [bacterium]
METAAPRRAMMEGSEAVSRVAYMASEVVAIYPITPSSGMAELADQWASEGRENLWGSIPEVVEMQSEGGVAGALHGALLAGSLCTTFTASQGLLLMIPVMYKIAGELTPTVFHVAARSLATHALSIFGDHSDVMAVRQTGWAMLCSHSVQEAQDMAAIAHAATLRTRLPFVHFFDGFRTSHETNKIDLLEPATVAALLSADAIADHRARALTPDRPTLRGTAQNPDVFFQAREACNSYYMAAPGIIREVMTEFAAATGRLYKPFEYSGHPKAESVVVVMGSASETLEETEEWLRDHGRKVGVLKVRLLRPWSSEMFVAELPKTVEHIAVLDRCKEPGSAGEPLLLDVTMALVEDAASSSPRFAQMPRLLGGRYGLSSKEFTPAMARAVFDEMDKIEARRRFTVGIDDDVTFLSLEVGEPLFIEPVNSVRAVFYGLGADGTVGANKNTIKIIGEETDLEAQAYFIYDSKKSGSTTVSHLRFGPDKIRAPYLIDRATFTACHQFGFVERMDILGAAEPGGTLLLNAPFPAEEIWSRLPSSMRRQIVDRKLSIYTIDASRVASEAGLGGRINTVMQVCFFALANVLPRDKAIEKIKASIRKSYGKRGEFVVEKNLAAVDAALDQLHRVEIPASFGPEWERKPALPENAPPLVRDVLGEIIAGRGDSLPVSAMSPDGCFPTATSRWEKRAIAHEVPEWDPAVCIQCGKCVAICPHAVIRAKVYEPAALAGAPDQFLSSPSKFLDRPNDVYTLQISPDDCTGCSLCVEVCPAKNKSRAGQKAINMVPAAPVQERERANWDFFLGLPETHAASLDTSRIKDISLLQPLFEFSGACAGCGETPYLSLLSRLFGDRAMIANATGCSSIYGGNLPTTPWATNADGRGPAWANSLFEDNAEFGLGMRLAINDQAHNASVLVRRLAEIIPPNLAEQLAFAPQETPAQIEAQRTRVAELRRLLATSDSPDARRLESLAESLVRRSVWIVGGDGWAYDIGYGGLDHVLASGQDVNILVLDTEVYSNTGGQQSKSTPRAAVAKFAAAGKRAGKKDLAMLAMSYENVYVARVAIGANDAQAVRAFREAEAWHGPSIILAYSHCIAHGFDLSHGAAQQKAAVDSGHWLLTRFDPTRRLNGQNPLQIDSKAPSLPLEKYVYNEARYASLALSRPEQARELLDQARGDVRARWASYQALATALEPPTPTPVTAHKGDSAQ